MSYGFNLSFCDGPTCERCGCRDVRILSKPDPETWSKRGCARCNHCGLQFSFLCSEEKAETEKLDDTPKPGEYRPRASATCPNCKGKQTKVMKTMPESRRLIVRYHRCDCGHTFKTTEKSVCD